MHVYLNSLGEIACEDLGQDVTVSDMSEAIVRFCQNHIDCTICAETCCAGLIVYPDHVFVKSLLHVSRQSLDESDEADLPLRVMRFDIGVQNWILTQNSKCRCKFLSQSGRCLVYQIRPLVCRMHVCGKIEPGFQEIKNIIYNAYKAALRLKMKRYLDRSVHITEANSVSDNPVANKDTYDVPIADIIYWADVTQRGAVPSCH